MRQLLRMRYGWRGWSLFGAGTLFGVVVGAVLYAPPELGNQPPPWQHWARDQDGTAAAMRAAGAVPAQPAAAAPPQSASAAPEPMASASAPAPVAEAPVPVPQVVASGQATAKVANVSRAPAAKKQKVQSEVLTIDTSVAGAGPAPATARVEPEAFRAPAEQALPRNEGEGIEVTR